MRICSSLECIEIKLKIGVSCLLRTYLSYFSFVKFFVHSLFSKHMCRMLCKQFYVHCHVKNSYSIQNNIQIIVYFCLSVFILNMIDLLSIIKQPSSFDITHLFDNMCCKLLCCSSLKKSRDEYVKRLNGIYGANLEKVGSCRKV